MISDASIEFARLYEFVDSLGDECLGLRGEIALPMSVLAGDQQHCPSSWHATDMRVVSKDHWSATAQE